MTRPEQEPEHDALLGIIETWAVETATSIERVERYLKQRMPPRLITLAQSAYLKYSDALKSTVEFYVEYDGRLTGLLPIAASTTPEVRAMIHAAAGLEEST